MLPVIEALTRSTSPARSATIAMISSAALPKVALSRPPIVGPVRWARCSVASPMSPASGSTPRQAVDEDPRTGVERAPGSSSTRHRPAAAAARHGSCDAAFGAGQPLGGVDGAVGLGPAPDGPGVPPGPSRRARFALGGGRGSTGGAPRPAARSR